MTRRIILHRLGSSALVMASMWGMYKLWQVRPADIGVGLHMGLAAAACLGLTVGLFWWSLVWILKD